eukprot:TRINITY_DN9743_c0_g1_i1.p1 TRINITY_DN9743_c0_g1~~TRINITY_DN9743_c0_g1_i1.p1  ORF type:complete len:200 (+),score=45.93 TRINITY_DN9743_c0_g1_i1:45-602(+)
MTTAHRPTYVSAMATADTPGGNRQVGGTKTIRARDQAGELTLKKRTDLDGKIIKAPDDKVIKKSKIQDADIDLDSSDSESSDDSDEELEVRKELERLKEERQQASLKKAREEQERREEEIIKGNPLLKLGEEDDEDEGNFKTKRRWDDDVLFKNQTRTEPEVKRRFINDSVRNDFHRRFLDRYMK